MDPNTPLPGNQPGIFSQPQPQQQPQLPVEPPFQGPQPEPKKPFNKKLFIILASVIVGSLLIIGAVLFYMANVRATPEEYEQAQALVVKIEAQNEASRTAYARSIQIATTEMTKEVKTANDYKELLAYDRKKEITASNEKLSTETEALSESLAELKDSPALKDKAVRAEYDEFVKTADAYVLSSRQLIESSPAMADIVVGCFQAESNIFTSIDTVLDDVDDLVDDVNAVAGNSTYNPDTALAKFESKNLYKKCNAALTANDKTLSHPTLEGTRKLIADLMAALRQQVIDYASEYKKGGIEPATVSFNANTDKIEALINDSQKKMTEDQKTYVAGLDIEEKSKGLKAVIDEQLKSL